MTVLLLLGCAAGGPAGDDTAVPAGAGRGVVRPGGPVGGCGTPAPEVDVVVVGAGPAGLAAAAEVRAAGGTARILERSGAVGGSATWAGGLMLFSGTDEQREAGVEDDAETLLAEWPDLTGGTRRTRGCGGSRRRTWGRCTTGSRRVG